MSPTKVRLECKAKSYDSEDTTSGPKNGEPKDLSLPPQHLFQLLLSQLLSQTRIRKGSSQSFSTSRRGPPAIWSKTFASNAELTAHPAKATACSPR